MKRVDFGCGGTWNTMMLWLGWTAIAQNRSPELSFVHVNSFEYMHLPYKSYQCLALKIFNFSLRLFHSEASLQPESLAGAMRLL
jgi:hypothetical protein